MNTIGISYRITGDPIRGLLRKTDTLTSDEWWISSPLRIPLILQSLATVRIHSPFNIVTGTIASIPFSIIPFDGGFPKKPPTTAGDIPSSTAGSLDRISAEIISV